MALRSVLKWLVIITVVLSTGFTIGYFSSHAGTIQLTPSSNLFSTGTVIRNIGVAIFAISAWYSQHYSGKANQLLRTLKVDDNTQIALELVISLTDMKGLEELGSSIDPKDKDLIRRKIRNLKQVNLVRNLSIVLFLAGVSIEIVEVILNWLA